MSSIQLTYDSRQDRILLCSGMDITLPNWWMTRSEVRNLLKLISTVTTSQYQTEKIIEKCSKSSKVAGNVTMAAVKGRPAKRKTYREFHQSHAGDNTADLNDFMKVESYPEHYPLAVKMSIDLSDNQGLKLFLSSESQCHACLELSQEDLYTFNNSLFTVSQSIKWI